MHTLTLLTAALLAAPPAPGHSLHGEAFDDGPRRAARPLDDVGRVSFPVTTAWPGAQAFVNQGVAQLHTFQYFEAERSFRQAALLDPACGMAYWGMAFANENNAKRARGFLAEARKRQDKLTDRERLYLDALAAYRKEDGTDKERRQAWVRGLEAVVEKYPDDPDAAAWLVMAVWQGPKDGVGSRLALDRLLSGALRDHPAHPGALHYRIHIWDHVAPERAVSAAERYGPAAPGIAHAWHMPGHTFGGLNRHADAAYQQEASARVDHAYLLRDRVMPFEVHNYAHNNQWLSQTLAHLGRPRAAAAAARDLVEQPRDPEKNDKAKGDSAQRAGRGRWAEALARYELWDELLEADRSGALDWSDAPREKAARAYALGLTFAAKGKAAKLAEQVAALKALPADGDKKGDAKPGVYGAQDGGPTAIDKDAALAELEGHQKLAAGDVAAAFARFAAAGHMRPEAMARAHLGVRNYGLAVAVAKAWAEKSPNQVSPWAAYVEALHAAGDAEGAKRAYRKLPDGAEAGVPVLERLAKFAAGWERDPAPPPAARPVELAKLGPLAWSPAPAPPLALPDADGRPWALADRTARGKNVLVVFFLGGGCVHCVQQLKQFAKESAAFAAADTELVAVSADDPDGARAVRGEGAEALPFPVLADPSLGAFKAWHAYDDFEARPLHAVVLVDARGGVRYQKVSADPFLKLDFLKAEAARLKRLAPPVAAAAGGR